MNLVTDVFPALAFAGAPGSPRLMNQPARDPNERLREWVGLSTGEIDLHRVLVAHAPRGALIDRGSEKLA